MQLQEQIQLLLVLLVGVPAALLNHTAKALVGSYFFVWGVYIFSGDGVPERAMLIGNMAVIAAAFSKHEISLWDKAIIMLYPAVWFLYTHALPDYQTYWALWFLFVAQIVLAGSDALSLRITAVSANQQSPEPMEPMARVDFDLCWSTAGNGQ